MTSGVANQSCRQTERGWRRETGRQRKRQRDQGRGCPDQEEVARCLGPESLQQLGNPWEFAEIS